jgi:hypothetical protein
MFCHETANLGLDDDGDVFRIFADEDGDRDVERLGDVESCASRVPDEAWDEYHELLEVWEGLVRERRGYERGIEAAWSLAKGC